MPLCSLCQSIDLLDIPKLSPVYNRYPIKSRARPFLVSILNSQLTRSCNQKEVATPVATPTAEPLGYPYHLSLDELKTAAKACAICAIVDREVAQFQIQLKDAQQDQTYGRPEKGQPDWKMYLARGVNDTGGFIVVSFDTFRPSEIWVVAAVGLCVDYNDPLESLVRGRKIQNSISKSLTHALKWVRESDDEPTDARPQALPAKILDVESDTPGGVALYIPKGKTARYAVLSHVWGEMNPFTTSRADLEAHENGIDTGQLPKTFSDAIIITRKIGLRYLWIDAICMCQDDEADWGRETANLSSVYSNAYIVLSATGSGDDSKGLTIFDDERPLPVYESFEYTTNGFSGNIHAFSSSREIATMPGMHALLRDEPLSQRGWALQERWLAPRILHFGAKQMFFECDAYILSEDGYKMQGRSESIRETAELEVFRKKHANDLRHTWICVINAYCRLKLTRSSDKLPALSGLARVVAERMNDTYVAGMWRSSLIETMMWQAVGTTSAVSQYRAPSWSWASIDGPFVIFCSGAYPDDGEWATLATVIDCQVTLKGENPYGEITSAHLELRAPLEPLTPGEEEVVEGFPPRQKGPKMKTRNGSNRGTVCIFDTPQHAEEARGQSLYAVVLMSVASGPQCSSAYHSIIVAPVEGKEGTYRRVGKIPIQLEDLGECEWMEDESKMPTFILV